MDFYSTGFPEIYLKITRSLKKNKEIYLKSLKKNKTEDPIAQKIQLICDNTLFD
jgi:hypothetical protein